MKNMMLALVLIASQNTAAAAIEVWEGSGSLFNLQGQEKGGYRLLLENTRDGDTVQSKITVTLPDGSVSNLQCTRTQTGSNSWKSECGHGKGGGHCFGEGLCISYEENSTGKAYATTIVKDGPSNLRLLRTELQNGRAVQFFREKLHKR